MLNRRTVLTSTAMAALATTLSPSALAQGRKDSMVVGMTLEPPGLDPTANAASAIAEVVHYNIFESLTKINADGKITPLLAESWEVSPDLKTYTFKLRRGVKFHDGSPLTSEDIKASYDRIISPPQGVVSIRKSYYSDLEVSAPDPATVVFKLKNPMAGVLEALASPYNCIYSAAKLKQNPRYPETEIMGSGAFTFRQAL